MSHSQPSPLELPADHHALLADPLRRRILAHAQKSTTDVTTLDALADDIQTPADVDADALMIRLHHVVLPRLAAADVLAYDARSNTVRFRDHPLLDRLDDRLAP